MLTLISLLSFLLPSQLAYHFNSIQSTVYGFQIDYLIPTLYFTDIIILLIIFFGVKYLKINKSFKIYVLFYVLFVAINILISSYQTASIYRWLKITELILFGLIVVSLKKFDIFNHFVKPLSYSVLIACVLGVWQFIIKGSVGGFFYWFGERSFIFSDPNVAPYPYSFFSHPNSFAGFLLVFGIFLLDFKSKFKINYFWLLTILVVTNLVLTNSLNIYITIVLILILIIHSNLTIALKKQTPLIFLTLDFSQRFISHRLELIKASWQMIKSHFWFGVGLNNFIPNLVKVSNTFINAWELQPVHNIFLLIFSETGIIGLSILFFLFYSGIVTYNLPLMAILFSGLNDHYWLTLQQNMLLFTYVLVISKRHV